MPTPAVTLVKADDWEGLYVNGVLKTEGHEVRLEEILAVFGVSVTSLWADSEWLADRGYLPATLDQVKPEE